MQHADYQKLAVYYKLLHFATFVSVVSRQFISFVMKIKIVAKITSSQLCSRVCCVFAGTESIS